jgi:ferredoxin
MQAAAERGLLHAPEDIEVIGDGAGFHLDDFKNIERADDIESFTGLLGLKGKLFNRIAKSALSTRPKLKSSECIGCRKCYNVCPAHAIEMRGGKPKIDRGVCIRCFCCQEFCPKGALKVHRPVVARILTKSDSSSKKK